MRGDGSVYTESDGKGGVRWVAQLYVPGRPTPVKRRLSRLPDGKGGWRKAEERDAEKLLREMRRQAARGQLDPKKPEPERPLLPTVAEVLEDWLADGCRGGKKPGGVGDRTADSYASLIRTDLAPSTLGKMRLDDVRVGHIEAVFDDLAATKDRARDTLAKERSILSRAFRRARKDPRYEEALTGWVDPVDLVDLPSTKPAGTRRALKVVEIRPLLAAVAGNRLLGGWVPLGIDGIPRPGELAALEWNDLDLTATPATATFVKSIAWVKDKETGRIGPVLTDGKTHDLGHRRVTLSPITVAALTEHRTRMKAERDDQEPGYWPDVQNGIDLRQRVFLTEHGRLVEDDYVRRRIKKAATTAGIGHVVPYDLRHTGATLIDERKDRETTSKALGHVVAGGGSITAGYIHTKLVTVDSTVLDDALAETDAEVSAEPPADER